MPMIGGGDQDNIELFDFEKFSMILECLRARSKLLRFVDILRVNVAKCGYIHRLALLKLGQVVTSALANADHPKPQPVVRAQNARIGNRGRGGSSQERAALDGSTRHDLGIVSGYG